MMRPGAILAATTPAHRLARPTWRMAPATLTGIVSLLHKYSGPVRAAARKGAVARRPGNRMKTLPNDVGHLIYPGNVVCFGLPHPRRLGEGIARENRRD